MGLIAPMLMKGQPLTTKLAKWSVYGVLPGAMIAAFIYSPPDSYSKANPKYTK